MHTLCRTGFPSPSGFPVNASKKYNARTKKRLLIVTEILNYLNLKTLNNK